MLVSLGREASHFAEVARLFPFPGSAHGMRTILDHRDPEIIANFTNGIQVGDVAAHVREHQELGATFTGLGAQIVNIGQPVVTDLDEHGHRTNGMNSARYRCQSVSVGQNFVAGFDPDRP